MDGWIVMQVKADLMRDESLRHFISMISRKIIQSDISMVLIDLLHMIVGDSDEDSDR